MEQADFRDATGDPYRLQRFLHAQDNTYEQALSEIRSGRKRSHWMWYIFPQIEGLGVSATARLFSIKSVTEAEHYLAHPILGPRLIACAEAAVRVSGVPAIEIFGSPDDLKLRSSATLFASLSAPGSVFHQVIDKYFDGEPDERTIQLMSRKP